MVGSLLYADFNRLVTGSLAVWQLVGTARGGGQMKDDCAAAGVRCRERESVCVCLSECFACVSEFVHVSLKDGTLIPPRQSPSLLRHPKPSVRRH